MAPPLSETLGQVQEVLGLVRQSGLAAVPPGTVAVIKPMGVCAARGQGRAAVLQHGLAGRGRSPAGKSPRR